MKRRHLQHQTFFSPRPPSVHRCTLTCRISGGIEAAFSPFSFISSVTFQNKDHSSLPIPQFLPPIPPSLCPPTAPHSICGLINTPPLGSNLTPALRLGDEVGLI